VVPGLDLEAAVSHFWRFPRRHSPIAEYAAFDWHLWIAKNIFMSILPVLDPVVYFTELSLAVAYILGFLVRSMAWSECCPPPTCGLASTGSLKNGRGYMSF
jgi:hypothetical protein